VALPRVTTNLPSRTYRLRRVAARCCTPREGRGACHRQQDHQRGLVGNEGGVFADVAGWRYAEGVLEVGVAGGHNVVTYFTTATDLRAQLRGTALRSFGQGTGPRVGVNAVPTSFRSVRFYELRHDGVLRSCAKNSFGIHRPLVIRRTREIACALGRRPVQAVLA
jgi:hypothetical protein